MSSRLIFLPAAVLLMGATEPDWANIYRSDLDAIRATFQQEHPGLAEPIDQALRGRLEKSYARAKDRRAMDYASYAYGLSGFIGGIGDPHSFFYVDTDRAGESWPSFAVAKRGSSIVVADRLQQPQLPSLGATLLSCDGTSADKLEQASIKWFGDARNPAFRQWAATYILVHSDPTRTKPGHCTFASGGKNKAYTLKWRPLEGNSFLKLRSVAFGAADDIGIDEIAPQVYWINLPTFAQSDDAAPKLRSIVDAIKADPHKFRNARAVIFDVRLNGGGFVSWGNEILSALYGKEYLDGRAIKQGGTNDWRATADTLKSLRKVSDDLRRIGADKEQIEGWNEVVNGVSKALAEGKPFYRNGDPVPGPEGGLTRNRPRGAGPFSAKVVFLADPLCASACLLFADKLLALPGVTHVGASTGGDGIYTQVREITTPSGQGKYQLSQVVVRGRPRGDMEYYKPDISYSGEWTEAAYRQWVLGLLKQGKLTGPIR